MSESLASQRLIDEALQKAEEAEARFRQLNRNLGQLSRGSLIILTDNYWVNDFNVESQLFPRTEVNALYIGCLDYQSGLHHPAINQNANGEIVLATVGFVKSREIITLPSAPALYIGKMIAHGTNLRGLSERVSKGSKEKTSRKGYLPEYAVEIFAGDEAEEWLSRYQYGNPSLNRARNYLWKKLQASGYF